MRLLKVARQLWLGIVLIAVTSGILLVSDLSQRTATHSLPRVAVFQIASQSGLDDGVRGIVDRLAEHGYVDGKTISLKRFNAENDVGTANAIARQITNGEFDLIVTASTMSMQTVASANKSGKTKHVFGIVTDPFSAGIGISRENPLDHPKYMTGIGSMMPPERAFAMAREMNPSLKTVGLVWNPAESNSLAFTTAAREACKRLGITLLEANAENTSNVQDAAASLVSRGVQAIWVSGDVTVLVSIESVVKAAGKGHIPVFTVIPPNVSHGALFDLGANYYEVGKQAGDLAAKVLGGTDPATVPVMNVVPERLAINRAALVGLRDSWQFTPQMIEHAEVVVDETGLHDKSKPAGAAAAVPGAERTNWASSISRRKREPTSF